MLAPYFLIDMVNNNHDFHQGERPVLRDSIPLERTGTMTQNDQEYEFGGLYGEIAELMERGADATFSSFYYRRLLRRTLHDLKKSYTALFRLSSLNQKQQWLRDNFYLAEKEIKQLLLSDHTLRVSYGSKERSSFFPFIQLCVDTPGFPLTTSSLCKALDVYQSYQTARNFELEYIIDFIKVAACLSLRDIYLSDKSDCTPIQRLFGILSSCDTIDTEQILREKSVLEHLYDQDPTGDYPKMTDRTRRTYRDMTARIAIKEKCREDIVAKEMLDKSNKRGQHIGTPLYARYARYFGYQRRHFYWWTAPVAAILASLVLGALCSNPFIPLLIVLPVFDAAKTVCDHFYLRRLEHHPLPAMNVDEGLPDAGRTLAVISTMFSNAEDVRSMRRHLVNLFQANPDPNIRFCILADLAQSDKLRTDGDRFILSAASKLISQLNQKYHNRFFLVVRGRSFCRTQGAYTGYERKRGAITELIQFIKGKTPPFILTQGDTAFVRSCRYIMALDADTNALMDSISGLVSRALHPLNRPIIRHGRVVHGYGIFVPDVAVDLRASLTTPFAKIMGGLGGVSAYDTAGADLYQDLFHEGIFAGKGLINVDVFHRLLGNFFPPERILSHDILEGGFLRAAFIPQVQMTDGIPSNPISYFKRQHRWIRGDLQNTPYLWGNVPGASGTVKNPLGALSRYKLLDNVRRAVTPILSTLCLILAVFCRPATSAVLTFAAILGTLSPFLLSFVSALITAGLSSLTDRYYSRALPAAAQSLCRVFYDFVLLPHLGIISLDALLRVIWRMAVSKKNLLQWTTAAQAESGKNKTITILRTFAPAVLIGLLLLISPYGFTRLCGVFFSLVIPLVLLSGRPYPAANSDITDAQRALLKSDLQTMWRFYEDYAGQADHFLPPDNVQLAPVYAVAHRTSPTNIGLMLLSALAARDFDVIPTSALASRVENTVSTLEKLRKWNGNLYNWYDTQTLEVLPPLYVSAVDSGNLACCLVALKEGLKEYQSEHPGIPGLIERIELLIRHTDIGAFYDKQKCLLSIGYEVETGRLSPSHYDMLMSESRMTSYFAIACRQIPKKHWGALSRTLARLGRHTGPVSWTGTMFEYYMPELLLHCMEGSLGFEGLRFCLYAQRQRTASLHLPFGISESGYYAFDTHLNYQYKAHGVQRIALKQGQDLETVVSPYSSYLTLGHDFSASFHNLQRLRLMGMGGMYGLYEALDFTPSRVGEHGMAIVKSYMAHHMGMSIVAISNALMDNIMQKRFLSDEQMDSCQELLQEKVPLCNVVLDDPAVQTAIRQQKQKKPNTREGETMQTFDKFYIQQPKVHLLSNGELTSVQTDLGASFLLYQGADITKRTLDLLRYPQGTFCAYVQGEEVHPLTYLPMMRPDEAFSAEFSQDKVSFYHNALQVQCGMEVSVKGSLPCEIRRIAVKSREPGRIVIYTEPVLSALKDYLAHPAFSKLFLNIRYLPEENIFICSRKSRHSDDTLYMACGFVQDDIHFSFCLNRERVLASARFGERPVQAALSFELQGQDETAVPDPCIWLSVPTQPGKTELSFFTCTARSEEEVLRGVKQARRPTAMEKAALTQSPLRYDSVGGRLATAILPQILFHKRDSTLNIRSIEANRLPVNALWGLGVSGDLPIILLETIASGDDDRVPGYLECCQMLRLCGIETDLVFTYNDQGDYDRPAYNRLRQALQKAGFTGSLDGKSGVHLVDMAAQPPQIGTLLRAAAVHIAPKTMVRLDLPTSVCTPFRLQQVNPPVDDAPQGTIFEGGVFHNDGVTVTQMPDIPWCHVLANPTFGTLLSTTSLGYTYYINARENKLTPWTNDVRTDNAGELLVLRIGDAFYSLTRGARCTFTPDQAIYEGKAVQIETRVTVRIAPDAPIKEIEVELMNTSSEGGMIQPVSLAFYTEPVLDVNPMTARQISAQSENGCLTLHNPFNSSVKSYLSLASDTQPDTITTDRVAFWSGNWEERSISSNALPCATLIHKRELPPRRKEKIKFVLAAATDSEAAHSLAVTAAWQEVPIKPALRHNENSIRIETPDQSLNALFNRFLWWQTLGCRIFARTGFFQCGGAFGFRDQLQDACQVVLLNPDVSRQQILRACASQFPEGDVLHWWHSLPKNGKESGRKGVRTRYSDDLLWLPYTVCEYLEKTCDYSILSTSAPFCTGPALAPDEHERYLEVTEGEEADVYEHCRRAIQHACRFGEHGLPLMGCGDWNDGYNGVGIAGRGESVWLALFLSIVLERFSRTARLRGADADADGYLSLSRELKARVDEHCWDGDWYLRAFYDDGTPMGSGKNDECQIDSLPQSFAVLARLPDRDRVQQALRNAVARLVDFDRGIIRLFDPPFAHSAQKPGYVKSYPPGIRENGGQYTHGAVWLSMAVLRSGDAALGYRLIQMLNPVSRYDGTFPGEDYKTEPYYMAADVYTHPDAWGRGGWSLYTGAAGWYYRAVLEDLLGIVIADGQVHIHPHLPPQWEGYQAQLRYAGTEISITVDGEGPAQVCVPLDGGHYQIRVCGKKRKTIAPTDEEL